MNVTRRRGKAQLGLTLGLVGMISPELPAAFWVEVVRCGEQNGWHARDGQKRADFKGGREFLCRFQFVGTLAIPSDYIGVAGMQALRSIEFGFILVSCNR